MAQHEEVKNGVSEKNNAVVVFTSVKPQLLVKAPMASDAVVFYKAAFGAIELERSTQPKRKADQELPLILSAQLQIAGTTVIVSDLDDQDSTPVSKTGRSGFILCLETEDVEAAVGKAVSAGAVAEGDVADGDGGRVLKDPYGFVWGIRTPGKKSAEVEA